MNNLLKISNENEDLKEPYKSNIFENQYIYDKRDLKINNKSIILIRHTDNPTQSSEYDATNELISKIVLMIVFILAISMLILSV